MKAMIWAKVKLAAAFCLGAVVVAGGGVTPAVGLAAAEPAAPAVAGGPSETVVSITSHWRYWLTARPPKLVEPFTDARGNQVTDLAYGRGAHLGKRHRPISTPAASEGWERPDFDDSTWPVQRLPVCTGTFTWLGTPEPFGWFAGRTRFLVSDSAAVKRLTLSVTYVGGLVVYLNGTEVARAHLPAGKLLPEARAEAYPKGAYMPADEEEAKLAQGMLHRDLWVSGLVLRHLGPRNRRFGPEDPRTLFADKLLKRRLRVLEVEVPVKLLRKGLNVLALDARQAGFQPLAARMEYSNGEWQSSNWEHLKIIDLALRASPAGSVRPPLRPAEPQLWAEDLHRWIVDADFLEPGVPERSVRIVATRGGTFSGQAVLGTASGLSGLKASVGDLVGPGGARVPASAVKVRYGVPLSIDRLEEMNGREVIYPSNSYFHAIKDRLLRRYTETHGLDEKSATARLQEAKQTLHVFDHLSDSPPTAVPAGSSQTIWLTLGIPKDARPGQYEGKLTVSANGRTSMSLEVRVMVMDYALPDPKGWVMFLGLEMSPYSVAQAYGLTLWSEKHWKRVEECFQWLGAVGNNAVQVPLIAGTEMGNSEGMVTWVKKGEGYEYDWALLDRYLGLARKYYSRPLALALHVHLPFDARATGTPQKVPVLENGNRGQLELPLPGTEESRKLWVPFARALVAHVREKQLVDTIHWGYFTDWLTPTQEAMGRDLAEALPEIGWWRVSHDGNVRNPFPKDSKARVDYDAHIRGRFQEPDWSKGGLSRMGWKRRDISLLFPRMATCIAALANYGPLWSLRELPEMAVASNARGLGRLGANYWSQFDERVKANIMPEERQFLQHVQRLRIYMPMLNYLLFPSTMGRFLLPACRVTTSSRRARGRSRIGANNGRPPESRCP